MQTCHESLQAEKKRKNLTSINIYYNIQFCYCVSEKQLVYSFMKKHNGSKIPLLFEICQNAFRFNRRKMSCHKPYLFIFLYI